MAFIAFGVSSQTSQLTIGRGNSDDMKWAIEKLNGTGILYITGEVTINDNISIPEHISLIIDKTGSFKIKNLGGLKVLGKIEAGLHPIFDNPIDLSQSAISEIPAEWFGCSSLAINNALLSAGRIPVTITFDYDIDHTLVIDSHQTLRIEAGTLLLPSATMRGNAVIKNKNSKDTDITITGGVINGLNAPNLAYDGILFNGVSNATIKDISCIDVHTTASRDTGNIHLIDCDYNLIQDCNITGTWKMGIFVLNGSCNTVKGGKFYGTHDSAIGVVNSYGTTVDGLFVDNCGTSDGSNMSLNSERMLVINNTSINAGGKRNGNGITLGHDGAPASNSICMGNEVSNNQAKGIFIQGKGTKNIFISGNKILNNGITSNGVNSGGIAIYTGSSGHLIDKNLIEGNRLGVSLHTNSRDVTIINNTIKRSTFYGIRINGENVRIEANYLDNKKNILRDAKHKHLTLKNNITRKQYPEQ